MPFCITYHTFFDKPRPPSSARLVDPSVGARGACGSLFQPFVGSSVARASVSERLTFPVSVLSCLGWLTYLSLQTNLPSMCGISALLHFEKRNRFDLAPLLTMHSTLAHRGPDGEGFLLLNDALEARHFERAPIS